MVIITEPFENHPSKIFALAFSLILTLIVCPLLYLITKYEKDQHNRTLINQLLSVIIYVALGSISLQLVIYYRFIFGKVLTFFCFLELFYKARTAMVLCLLLDAICVVRYNVLR